MDISIIIPHRNIPELLKRCIDSIPITNNIEVIIVDDNSDDEIVDFTHFPGKERPNTQVIFTKKGKGAGYARNIGMKEAKGNWIMFSDADDFFLPNAFDIIMEHTTSDYNVVYFNTIARMSDNLEVVSHRMDFYIKGINSNDNNRLRYGMTTSLLKLISHELLIKKNLSFEEIPVSNDIYFCKMLGYYARNIKKDLRPIMCITERSGSIMVHRHTKEERIIRMEAILKCNKFLNSIGMSKYCSDAYSWYFDPQIKYTHEWLNIKYLLKCISLSRLDKNTFKHLYWAIKNLLK
jgi:glycosyltransferase involved in cell wall biosynthesis